MLKLGITRRAALSEVRTRLGSKRQVSVLVMRELAQTGHAGPEAFDRVVEQVRMANGTWKFTCHGRFARLDALVLNLLGARFSPDQRLTVLDVAASTGITSVEFYRFLSRAYSVEFIASDLYRDVITVGRGPWVGVFDARGEDIQHVVGPFVLPARIEESWAYPVNRWLKRLCQRRLTPRARVLLQSLDAGSLAPFAIVRVQSYEVSRLPLLSSECLALMRDDPSFRFEVRDVLEPLGERGHVVRAMNILTREHFRDAERARIIRNCIEAVRQGGLLILGWSPKEKPAHLEASVYAVEPDGLVRLATVNGGSEIDRFLETIVRVRRAESEPLLHAEEVGSGR